MSGVSYAEMSPEGRLRLLQDRDLQNQSFIMLSQRKCNKDKTKVGGARFKTTKPVCHRKRVSSSSFNCVTVCELKRGQILQNKK